MENDVDVSVVLAVYNEEDSVAKEISIIKDALSRSRYKYEIIVIDDASTDNTPKIISSIDGIRIITHRRNLGSGGSRKSGTLAARGEVVVWTDADLTYPNELIPALVDQLKKGNYSQIVGARLQEAGTVKLLRAPAKFILRKLASFLAKTDIPDLNSGLRAFYKKDAMNFIYLVPNGFSCVSTMTLAFLCNGLEVGYMDIEYKERVGKSKFHPIKDTYNYFLQIIRMITYFEPIRIFVPLSMFVFGVTFIKNIIDLILTKNTQESDIVGYFIAFIIFAIGLLADLIVVSNKRFYSNRKGQGE